MIHKQHLELVDVQIITIPLNAEILSVAKQKIGGMLETLCVWYYFLGEVVDTKDIEIRIVKTGENSPNVSGSAFRGTFVMENEMVFHVFEMPQYN